MFRALLFYYVRVFEHYRSVVYWCAVKFLLLFRCSSVRCGPSKRTEFSLELSKLTLAINHSWRYDKVIYSVKHNTYIVINTCINYYICVVFDWMYYFVILCNTTGWLSKHSWRVHDAALWSFGTLCVVCGVPCSQCHNLRSRGLWFRGVPATKCWSSDI
jgi:hypothetical protein